MGDLLERLRAALAGRYAVETEVGRGGMATVFLAQDLKHRRQVAIKVLEPELSASLGGERFLREIEIAAQLQHPHILPLYDSGEAQGLLYYVMPFVEGESLRDRLTREGQLPLADALQIAREVADALSYAHSRGVVHRDIKPENVMLSGGHAVVADFGIARAVSAAGGEHLTRTGAAIGTPAYMSPEQAMGQPVDARGDQYSLACTLYEMLVGQPPFTGPTPQAIMARHSLEAVPSLQVVRNTIPDDVEDTIMRAMAKVPADRFPTVAQFAEMLAAASPAATGRHTAARGRRPAAPRWPITVAATAAVALAAVVAWQLWLLRPTAPASALGRAGGPDPRNVAVLYFEDRTGGELAEVADGLTEALIDHLATVQALSTVSANGVRPYRDASLTRDSIARALGVGTLITGSLTRENGRLRVAVHLADHEGVELERETFLAPADSVLAIRDSLASEATDLLRSWLGEEVERRELRAGTTSDAAWLLVQRAEKLRNDADHQLHDDDPDRAAASFDRADSLLGKAEQLDPAWAEPAVRRAHIAYTRARLAASDPAAAEVRISTGLAHAERALALDGRNADALEARGSLRYLAVLLGLEHDHAAADRLLDDAERDFRQATEHDGSQARAWAFLAHLSYAKHDLLNASITASRAYAADAYLSGVDRTLWLLYTTSYDLDQHNNAARWCDELRRRFPDDPRGAECRLWLMTTRARVPEVALAWQLADRLVAATPAHDREFARLNSRIAVAGVLARAGLADSAARVQLTDSAARVLRSTEGHRDVDPGGDLLVRQAFVYTLLDDRDNALRSLTQYVNAHREYREGFGKDVHWWWRSLQNDPRFRSLMGTGN